MKARSLVLLLGLSACSASAADVTGVWAGHATDPRGNSQDLTFNLKAVGNNLTGTVMGPPPLDSGLSIVNGKIEGDQVSFAISVTDPDGSPAKFIFTVKVAGNQMQGSIANRAGHSLPFTATKTSSSPHAVHPTNVASDVNAHPPNPQGSNPTPEDAQEAILAAFAKYEVVGLGILSYANQDFDGFILALIRNPAFPDKVNDIAVECGNSLYQPILDRYIAGEDVPLIQARQVWRNTTQPMCGLSGFYEELFPLVRRLNQRLPPGKKLRVLACDPPVDWSEVESREDLRPFMDRDASIASVMETEVLAKHRKALMIFGVYHLMHGGGGAVGRYERKGYPNATFVIMAHNGFGNHTPLTRYNDELEKRMAAWPVPSLVAIKGTWLADLDYAYFFPDERGRNLISTRVDGYLYLGPRDVLLNQPIPAANVLDKDYMAELRRRADRTGGPMRPEAIW